MMKKTFTIKGKVQIFPVNNPWMYVSAPKKYTILFQDYMERGLVAIEATIGEYTWKTSLLPKGDGTLFIAVNACVRKKENISLGDSISISFKLRKRK